MISSLAAWVAGVTLAAAGDCTRSTQIPPTPMIDPVTSAGRCQIIVADQLARLRSGSIPPGLEPTARDVAAASKDVFGLAGAETLHMLLRVGYSRKPAKSALRLPLERVYRDTTRS